MNKDYIKIRGTEEHNLKNLDVHIPRETFTVVTGLLGLGKSSLALDTVYAEGQRWYIESLSAYARNFLGQMDKPKVKAVKGLSPAISIDQKNGTNNPQSTVGIVTELHDYLRLLHTRVGIQYDPITDARVGEQSAQDMIDQILELPEGTRVEVVTPVVRNQKGEFGDLFSDLVSKGYARVEIDGEKFDLSFETPDLGKNYNHTIDMVVDHVKVTPETRSRIADPVETTLEGAGGVLKLIVPDPPAGLPFASNTRSTGSLAGEGGDHLVVEFSEELDNPNSSFRFSEIETHSFSFSNPHRTYPECEGLGKTKEVDPDLVVTGPSRPLKHIFEPWSCSRTYYCHQLDSVVDYLGVDVDTPFEELSDEVQGTLLLGTSEDVVFEWTVKSGTRHKRHPLEGIVGNLERRHVKTDSGRARDHIEEFMAATTYPDCNGSRLKEQSRHVRAGGTTLPEISRVTIAGTFEHFEDLEADLSERHRTIAQEILREIRARLGFMTEVGLEYLTLDREAATLSGGESQRIHLATQVGSGLVGILYILDELSIDLRQYNNDKLLSTLEGLRDPSNTLIVVEHDEETMHRVDEIIDMGPGPGERGGEVVTQNDFDDIVVAGGSITADYLSGRKDINVPESRREGNGELIIHGARRHNLDDLDMPIPLETFTTVTNVSGSGKSTLVHKILYKGLACRINDSTFVNPGEHGAIEGYDGIETVWLIDQSPIGRAPRSNPVTYAGVFDYVHELFVETELSEQHGYEGGRFSFNARGGRCEACKGQGNVKIEMNFLSDVYIPCGECNGARCNVETLGVTYKDKTIADVFDMEVDGTLDFFEVNSQTRRRLQLLHDMGLGYMQLGQPSTTLFGGETQRVKLAEKLGKKQTGDTLYLLDEPTTNLHKEDGRKLIEVFQCLADNDNTVLMVGHELDLVKNADHIVDLGPEGGADDGTIVASSTPEEIAANPGSHMGQYLCDYLPDVDEEGPRSNHRKSAKMMNDGD